MIPHFKFRYLILLILFTPFLLAGFSDTSDSAEPLVNMIEIKGLKRIEVGAVRSRLTQTIKEPLNRGKIAEDIKRIYQMGYFEDVRVEMEFFEGGLKLAYIVKEKPTISSVIFHGNKELEKDKLKEKINLIPGSIADSSLIQDNVNNLLAFYEGEGFYLAEIYPIINYISETEVSITFNIKEREKIKIKEIKIIGNEKIPDKKIKKAMFTKKWWILSYFTNTGYVKKRLLEGDIQQIKNLYYDNGYLDVTVSEPEIKLLKKKKKLILSFTVFEGEQYTISSVEIEGFHGYSKDVVQGLTKIKEGEIFSRKIINNDVKTITEFYSERGYALASVIPGSFPNKKAKTVNLSYTIDEGKIYDIGKIEINGNTVTRDKVIRREVRLDEGERFNSKLIERSSQRLNNLDYFESVDVSPRPVKGANLVDLDIKVKEKSTGFISFGGGYSSVDHMVIMTQVTQKNLFGRGQFVKVSAELGGKSTLYDISFKEPWFLDRPISFTSRLYNTEREYIDYSRKASGAAFSLGKRFLEYWAAGVTYKFEEVEVFDVDSEASLQIQDQEGTETTSSITHTITRDTRDNYADPSKGSRNSAYFTFAGIGGSNAFVKTGFDSMWFFPVSKYVFVLRGRVGYATGIFGEELPLYERYYVGGIETIRGLNFGEAGPEDDEGTEIGGTKEIIVNTEVIYPLFPDAKLKGVVFFDVGKAFDDSESFDSLKYTTGTGVRWFSPFGPVRVEYGFNLNKEDDEDAGKLEFSFGTMF